MQSDVISICEDVVLDSFNKANRFEDSILDQYMKNKYVRIFNMNILVFFITFQLTTQCYESLVLEVCIIYDMHFLTQFKNLKSP